MFPVDDGPDGLNGILLIVVKLRAKNRLRFCGDRWEVRGNRLAHAFALMQRVSMLSFAPLVVLVLLRWIGDGESFSVRWRSHGLVCAGPGEQPCLLGQ